MNKCLIKRKKYETYLAFAFAKEFAWRATVLRQIIQLYSYLIK